uniref:Uncharacterized protein n=1 Tax=Curvibacter symbiont subsp. Hydra magnipapillata TaxID=667019 RepID=C9Y947_CURXX|nr:hypothetical protein Csp_A06480 [Curvibacter putative symbiont of Hydra magnipapillata]
MHSTAGYNDNNPGCTFNSKAVLLRVVTSTARVGSQTMLV